MVSIKESVERARWIDAAEALASALSVLARGAQLEMAHSFIRRADGEMARATAGIWLVEGGRVPPLPHWEPEGDDQGGAPPWAVHLGDARDDLEGLEDDPPSDDAAFSSRIAAALWDAVVGLQVAAWAATQADDFQAWRRGQKTRGAFESRDGNAVAAAQWLELDRLVKEQAVFSGKTDSEIYAFRPAIAALRDIMEAA